jgi:BON domain
MYKMVYLAVAAALALLPAAAAMADSPMDKAIAQQIGARLKESGELRSYRIGVKYQDGVAWLSGSVTSAQQREAAERLARQIDGVSHVVCRLDIPDQASATIGETSDLHGALEQVGLSSATGKPTAVKHAVGRSAAPGAGMNMSRQQPMRGNMPLPAQRIAMNPAIRQASAQGIQQAGGPCPPGGGMPGGPMGGGAGMQAVPVGYVPGAHGGAVSYDNAQMPAYAWPTYASYPNYGALTYPRQYSPTAWPYIGPFYPYPQVPLGWRKVALEWDDGWWFLDFSHAGDSH